MIRIEVLGLIAITGGFNFLSGLVFLVISLSLVCLKNYIGNMDELKWDIFFNGIPANQYLIAIATIILISLLVTWVLIYYVLKFFSYENASLWSFIMFLISAISVCINFYNKKDSVLDVLNSLYAKFQN